MMEFVRHIMRPFIWARYSLFLKNNKSGQPFDIKDEYSMLVFTGTMTPIWPEATIVMILSDFLPINYGERLCMIAALWIADYIASKIIVRKLKRGNYIETLTTEFSSSGTIANPRYNSTLYCLWILCCYAVLPVLTIVIYYLVK